jgi:hypothetical protein
VPGGSEYWQAQRWGRWCGGRYFGSPGHENAPAALRRRFNSAVPDADRWSRPRVSSGLRVGVVKSKQSGRVAQQARWNIPQNGLRDRMNRLLALLLTVMSGAALAQTTGMVNPSSSVPAGQSVKEDVVPPGGCMPIGLTASGEVVFPIQCKEFIERHRGNAVEQKPSAVEEKAGVSLPAWANSDALVKPAQTEKQARPLPTEGGRGARRPPGDLPRGQRKIRGP